MLSLIVVLFGPAFFAACVLSGLWDLGVGLRRSGRERRQIAARGAAKVTAAALVAAIPWVAAPIAESSTGWVDTDHDGMLDGFVNGSYDWVDINGGAWATAAAVLIVMVVLILAALRVSKRDGARDAHERTHPQDRITYVVSGGGCKTTPVGRSSFTAAAAPILQFVLIDIDGDRLDGRCIQVDGRIVDRFALRARENR